MATSVRSARLALLRTLTGAVLTGAILSGAVIGPAPTAEARAWSGVLTVGAAPDAGDGALVRVTPSSTRARLGETIAFVAVVTNDTPAELVGLRVVSETDDEVTSLLGTRTDNGVFDPVTSTWFVERIEAGGTATLELYARAEGPGTARVTLLAAAEPTGAAGTAETTVEVTTWAADPGEDRSQVGVTAGLLLTVGGTLVAVAGLLHLRQRRRHRMSGHPQATAPVPDDPVGVGTPTQVASDPE